MIEAESREWAVYPRADFFDRYDGRMAILHRPEGMAVVWMGDVTVRQRELQHLDAETIIDGRTHRLVQRRTRRDRLTETGAKRVVTRWLRGLRMEDALG